MDAVTSDSTSLDTEAWDYTEAVFFERRFSPGLLNLTVFQQAVIYCVETLTLVFSVLFSFVARTGILTGVAFTVLMLISGFALTFVWARRIDLRNRDMRKTQGQFVIDARYARRMRGHWVNGLRRIEQTRQVAVVAVVRAVYRKRA